MVANLSSSTPTMPSPTADAVLNNRMGPQHRTVRPLGAYVLQGLTVWGDRLLALDTVRGYLLAIDPATDNTTLLNPHHLHDFIDARGLYVWEEHIWFTRGNEVFYCSTADFTPQLFTTLPYPADGVAVWQSTVYVASQRWGYIGIFERQSGRRITRFANPGVGIEYLTVRGEELWVSDDIEQTVYCLDRATGELVFSVLTPYASPAGLTFFSHPQGGDLLYVAYAQEEPYIRDDPNSPHSPHLLAYRDRTFIHPLHVRYLPEHHCALSNGYLIEMSYAEELSPLDEVSLEALEWRIALPADSPRQKVLRVDPIGMPFREEIEDGQRVAVFMLDRLTPQMGGLFGWKALLEVRGIKYRFAYEDVENIPPLPIDMQRRYLVDDDDLSMDHPVIAEAAREAIGTETNLLRKILKIRNYVYDRLSYAIKPHIDTPDIALERGTGSCGEYVGLLLALARLNGIACRTIGRYKCPPYPDRQGVLLEPDFNHVWLEFYIPGFGWYPMESNVDDVIEGGPYPNRFFMGLPWFHVEMSKGISFEKLVTPDDSLDVSIGDLALNHVRFTILGELPPP